jgi:hypothetical protein
MFASRLLRRSAAPVGLVAAATAYSLQDQKAQCGFFDFLKSKDELCKADIIALIEDTDDKRGDGTSIGPTFVRLAWHAAGTYSAADSTGGSNGSHMRMSPEKGMLNNYKHITTNQYPSIKFPELIKKNLLTHSSFLIKYLFFHISNKKLLFI